MKKDKIELVLTTGVCLLPILAGLAVYDRLPEVVATHWGADGMPNGYSSRAFAVFALPLFMAALNLFLRFALSTDPKKANMSPVLKRISYWILPVISVLGSASMLGSALGYSFNMTTAATALVGVMFIVIGNYLPKTKQSYTMGIKLPWTLNSAENWNSTHRLAGFLWVICGAVMLLCSLLHCLPIWLLLGLTLVMALVPTVY
ncbi:MAG: SdpI family protein, partial [Oscillospiraceae bacterium]|nr:SdpI family protein [Oscillospiraceae bacterium]